MVIRSAPQNPPMELRARLTTGQSAVVSLRPRSSGPFEQKK